MDSNEFEKERGITISSKYTSFQVRMVVCFRAAASCKGVDPPALPCRPAQPIPRHLCTAALWQTRIDAH